MGNAKEFIFFPHGESRISYRKYILTHMLLHFTKKIQGHFSNTTFLQYSIVPHILLLGNDLESIFSASYETFLA